MASDLKRVGLVFQADGTTDFKKSLTSINALTKESYAAFKQAQSQYDKNTSSIDKLRDRQEYLSKSTDLYRSKVEVLSEQLSAMESAENRNETAITKKKAELTKAQTALTNYEKGLNEVNAQLESGSAKTQEYADKIGDLSNKMTSAGKTLTKGVTAPLTAVGTAAMVAWNELDGAYDNIILKTGATGDALDELNESFDNVYGTMPSDSMDVSNAIGEVNTRFKLTGAELESLSKYMLQYADITGSDVTESTAYAQRIQGQWNLSLEDTKNVLGLVAKQSQDTGISTQTLMDAVTENASTFKEMGLTVGESVSLLAQFESAGLDNQTMLTGLKKASQNYAKSGQSMSDGLGDLITRLQDSSTYQEAYNEVVDLFGAKSALSFATAASEGKVNLSNLSTDLSNYATTVNDTFEGTLDPIDNAKVAMNNLKLAGSELGTSIQTALAPVLESLVEIINSVTEWFKGLDDTVKTVIVTVGMIVAAIGPLLVILGTVGNVISSGIGLLSNLQLWLFSNTGAMGVLQGAISALNAPVLAVIAVVGALIAILVDLWNNNEAFRQNVVDIVNNISGIVQNLYNSILKPIIDAVVQIITMLWTTCLKPLYENVRGMIATIISIMSQLWTAISPIINMIISILGTVLSGVLNNVVLPTFRLVFNTIGTIINTVFGAIKAVWDSVLHPVFNAIVRTINWLSSMFSSVFGSIQSTITRIFSAIGNAMSNPIKSAKDSISWLIGQIKGFFSGFSVSLPKISLPHPYIRPRGWSVGDLLKGSIPSIGIDWYDKAMDKGMILDGATIFGLNKNGEPMGGGETGSETVVGTNSLIDMITNAAQSGNDELLNALLKIVELLSPDNLYRVIVKAINDGGFTVELDGREVGRIVKKYA